MRGLRGVAYCMSFVMLVLFVAGCEQPKNTATAGKAIADKPFLLASAPKKYDVEINVNLDDKIRILGLNYSPKPLKHNQDYTITFFMQALDTIPGDYQFFGHFEPSKGPLFRGKMDHHVADGKYKTSQWRKGDIIRDTFKSHMPAGFPYNEGVLWGGFYKGDKRMPIAKESRDKADGEGRAKLAVLPLDDPPSIQRDLVVLRADQAITIDGKLDEAAWSRARSTGDFGNLSGEGPVKPTTSAKMLWDDTNLYIAFDCSDSDIWTNYNKKDDPLYREETTEVMIDADGSGSTYYEMQVNPVNAVYDAYFPKRRKGMDISWDAGLKSAVQVKGTVNQRTDKDQGWIVEMAIPLAAMKDAPNMPPKPGDKWRLNLYRMERPAKRGTIAAMWSPTLVGDFHTLNRFGTIEFSDKKELAQNELRKMLQNPTQPLKKSGKGLKRAPRKQVQRKKTAVDVTSK